MRRLIWAFVVRIWHETGFLITHKYKQYSFHILYTYSSDAVHWHWRNIKTLTFELDLCNGWHTTLDRSVSFVLVCNMTKPTKWPVRPMKTQISLGSHPIWSKCSLCAQWVAKDQGFMWTAKTLIRLGECPGLPESSQADRSLRWLHRSFCWFYHAEALLLLLFSGCQITQEREKSDIEFPSATKQNRTTTRRERQKASHTS